MASITIPKATEQVSAQAPRISAPQLNSGQQPAAFGTETGRAQQGLGEAVQKLGAVLGQRIIERQHLDQEQTVMAAHNDFNQSLQNVLYSPEADTDGTPKGLLNRNLDLAKGSTVALDGQYSKLRQEYIEKMPDQATRAALAARMDRDFTEHRNVVIRHEAAQDSENFKVQFHTTLERDPLLAQKVLDENKARLPQTMAQSLQESIDGKNISVEQAALWNTLASDPQNKLSDGSWNVERLRAGVEGLDKPQAIKEKMFDYIKARANEDLTNTHRAQEAQDRQAFNSILSARKSGQPLDEALKIATASGRDAYDVAQKQDFAKKVYAPPTESDKAVYLAIWERIQDGTLTDIKDIDKPKDGGLLSAGDWVSLRKEYRTSIIDGKNPAIKLAWERVGALAEDKYGTDKASKEAFLYVLHNEAMGKKPDEIITLAQDRLKNPKDDIGWKAVLNRMDAQAAKTYQQRISGTIQEQTPRLNAIDALSRKGKAITPEAIEAVLKIYPDGNWK